MSIHQIKVPPALDIKSIEVLAVAIDTALADSQASCIRMEGCEEVFCRGMDLETLVANGAAPEQKNAAVARFAHSLQALASSKTPTLAVVDGIAQGGGLGLAAACDVVIASSLATFALPEMLMGLVPATILPFLLMRMSPRTVRHWALTGSSRDVAAAAAAGLVDEVVESAELDNARRRWERQLSRVNPNASAVLKRMLADVARQQSLVETGIKAATQSLQDEKVLAPLRLYLQEGAPPWER